MDAERLDLDLDLDPSGTFRAAGGASEVLRFGGRPSSGRLKAARSQAMTAALAAVLTWLLLTAWHEQPAAEPGGASLTAAVGPVAEVGTHVTIRTHGEDWTAQVPEAARLHVAGCAPARHELQDHERNAVLTEGG